MPELKELKINENGQFTLEGKIVGVIPIGLPRVFAYPSRFGNMDWFYKEFFTKPLELSKPNEATYYGISENVSGGGATFYCAIQYYKLKE